MQRTLLAWGVSCPVGFCCVRRKITHLAAVCPFYLEIVTHFSQTACDPVAVSVNQFLMIDRKVRCDKRNSVCTVAAIFEYHSQHIYAVSHIEAFDGFRSQVLNAEAFRCCIWYKDTNLKANHNKERFEFYYCQGVVYGTKILI